MNVTEKRKQLEALGWKFERFSRSRKRWVRIRSENNRRLVRAIEFHYCEAFK